MKKLLVAGAVLCGLTGQSYAADLAVQTAYDWTGFYAGVHVGYGWGEAVFPTDLELGSLEGAFGGVQGGYNWQFDNIVVGLEADFSASDVSASEFFPGLFALDADGSVEWFGTARGRLGYALDNVLLYGTGGASFGQVELDVDGFVTGSADETYFGWTAGAGIEWGFSENWSAKAEYLFIDLGDEDFEIGGLSTGLDIEFHTVKVGLNYRF